MKYILALDIGIASVGWAVLDKESETVIEAGSNIFPEASAADNQLRRDMRGAKRNNRRLKTRINDFIKLWEKNNLSIPQFKSTEIVGLKVRAITEEITLDELYLILYSYLKHRGISYLEDALDDTVSGSSAYANGLKLNAKELETHYPCEIQQERLNTIGKYRGQSQIINDNGEVLDLSNVFTIGAYRKEIQRVFEIQKKYHPELTDEFCDGYMLIFNRKRKYYEGPGNEKSRTDYGRFTTKLDANGNYITEDNIFEKLIGKCSVYPDELRAAAASYTAQEYNVLNDLNNLTINGRKLEENEKHEIVERIKSSNTINMRKIISDCMGENIDDFAGARIDKSGKEIFHKFEVYNKMRKALLEIGIDISNYSREELDEIGYIMTINTDKEAMMEAFQKSWIDLSDDVKQCLINMRKTNGALFNKWQSFSLKIMNELIPEMYAQPKEQMTLLTEMGVTKGTQEEFAGLKYIPVDVVSEDIFNPVVRRSVRISFKILNAVLKKYKALDTIVIEMPRDRNSEEQKKRINDSQKLNEKEMEYIEKKLAVTYGIKLSPSDFSSQKQLSLKLKLWNEQDGICLYSGKTIDPNDIINNPQLFEIDHIIPRSISFDDARSNKVLVYRSENQKKGNQTPYYYLTHSHSEWSFEQYKATVMNLSKKKEYAISRKKIQNLLYSEDITKMDVLKGFINRNINDTSYASRLVLNTIQNFFMANEADTKVKVIKGSYTHQMRCNLKLDKNRDESYSHHAVDAMLASNLSTRLMCQLAEQGIGLMLCNQQHLPTGFYSAYDNHSRASKVIGFQIDKEQDYYGKLWQQIVKIKIENQAKAYQIMTRDSDGTEKIIEFSKNILIGDKSNREAHAAKVYFNLLMGTSFSRGNEDILLNSGLDYGYAVIRGYIARACVGYGLNTQIGIHHKSEYNRFNLVDDLMEPLRPIVDIVAYNSMKNDKYFTPEHRRKLVSILNMKIMYREKKMYMCNMIENYIEQYASLIMKRTDNIVFPDVYNLIGEEYG